MRFGAHAEKWKGHNRGAVFLARGEEIHYVSNGRDSERDLYRNSIAFLIQSLDPSLSTQLIVRLIVPTETSEIFKSGQNGLKNFEY